MEKIIDHASVIDRLEQNKNVFLGLFDGVPLNEFTWKPAPDKWGLLEIVCHLYDEEREDFRTRVNLTLTSPSTEHPPIDPEGWVLSRDYASQDYQEKLSQFIAEREESVRWLRSLQSSQWKNTYRHPRYGPMAAEFFLVNWLAHDLLHMRQIIRVKYQYLTQETNESLLYAGEW